MNSKNDIINQIKSVLPSFLPQNASLSLFGSRARGDASLDSDWDFLLLLDKPHVEHNDYKLYAYPLVELGWNLGEYFSVKLYTTIDWNRRNGTPFYKNVEQDKITL